MSGLISTKPIIVVDNGTFYSLAGKSSQRIIQNKAGVWAQSGAASSSFALTGWLTGLTTPGVMYVRNLGVDGVDVEFNLAVSSDANIFGFVKFGEEFHFRLYPATPLIRLLPATAGTFRYQVEIYED